MKDEAWENATPIIIEGLKNTDPIIKENLQWWITEVFHKLIPHTSSFKTIQMRAKNKIARVKEEGGLSHYNQAYDKYFATKYKAAKN